MFSSDIEDIISQIETDNCSGAAELTVRAARALRLAGAAGGDEQHLSRQIIAFGERIISAKPTMGSLFMLVNNALLGLTDRYAGETPGEYIERYCGSFLDSLAQNEETLYRKAAGVLREGDRILTHSASSTVRETILAAAEAGKQPSVICTESRPQCEGVSLARTLAEHGIPVQLIADAAMAVHLSSVDVILLGADAVRSRGFYNKIGTAMLAMAAHARDIDLYVLCTSHKFIPPDTKLPPQPEANPDELLANPPPGITPVNLYFEEIPLRHCAAVISEQGILKPAKLRQKLAPLKTAPLLLETLQGKSTTQS